MTLEVPDDIAQALGSKDELSRRALEALAVEGYRQEILTQLQVGKLLELARVETEDFLARHIDLYTHSMEELNREFNTLEEYFGR